MSYKIETNLVFQYKNAEEAEIVKKAFFPEMKKRTSTRSKISIEKDENKINLIILTTDLTILRSIINTYIRWIEIIEKVKKIGGGK